MNEKKKSLLRNQRYFNEFWLTDPSFKGWLCKEKDETKARCSLCHKTIELSSNGQTALTKGKKHQEIVMKINIFFGQKEKSTHRNNESVSSIANQQTLQDALISTNSARAEIIWILKCVMNGYSIRSNDDLFEMFSAMFPEFKSVKLFSMVRTKSMYVINHGIAPYFKSLVKAGIEKSDMFSFSFDENLMKPHKPHKWICT